MKLYTSRARVSAQFPDLPGQRKRVPPSEEYSAVRELSQTFLGLMRCGEGLLRAEARRS